MDHIDEKIGVVPEPTTVSPPSLSEEHAASVHMLPESTWTRWCRKLDSIPGLEMRGIERVMPEQRHLRVTTGSYVQMFIIWLSINCTANNMTLGILGPVLFSLGFKDAIL